MNLGTKPPGSVAYEFGPFRLNLAERVLTKGQKVIPLTPKAFDTLAVLVRNSGHVVEKDELLKKVWPDTFVEEGVLAVNVAALRKALNEGDDGRSYIETAPRRGYRFIGEVQHIGKTSEGEAAATQPTRLMKWWRRRWALAVGLLALALPVAFGWYASRSRPTLSRAPARPLPLTSYPGAELSPAFSPDGSQVAFSWNGAQQDNFDVYVKLVDRGDPLRLTQNPAPDGSPAWSPDGSQIAFVRQGAIFLVSPLGGPESKLADMQARQIAWTPDSKSLAVSSGGEGNIRIVLLSLETRETRILTAPAGKDFSFGDIYFAISPNGLDLAFARFPSAITADVFLTSMSGGEPRRLTENRAGSVWGIAWTRDGREVIYSAGRGISAALWRRRIEAPPTEESERLEGVEPGSVEPAISSGAQGSPGRMAYERVSLDTNIWVTDTKRSIGGTSRIIASSRQDAEPQFSPDGQRLTFSSDRTGRTQIWVCDSNGSNSVQLTSFTSGFATSPRWSPDGQRIVFSAMQNNNRDIYSISSQGGVARRLTTGPSHEGRPSWSRDGRWIYFYSTRSGKQEIWKMPAEVGDAVQVTTEGGNECFESPDGKLLYYQFQSGGLQAVSTSEANLKTGATLPPVVQPSFWAVAEKGIYFVEFDEKGALPGRGSGPYIFAGWGADLSKVSLPIKFYDFATRKTTQVGVIEKAVERNSGGFCVTRDGRRIAWSQIDHAESDLMMIENFR